MPVPSPTPIYRFMHVDNLHVCLRRGGLHAPKHVPKDGLTYKTIHNVDIQRRRRLARIPCGPGGVIHDYVAFYFGPRSPMLLQLHTGRVPGYSEGQEPIVYLVSTAQAVQKSGAEFIFSDGHGIAACTEWFDDLGDLNRVDWDMVYETYWADNREEMGRQRRKQAEFLVHKSCDWSLIHEIGVLDDGAKTNAEGVLAEFPKPLRRDVRVRREWYY